MSDVKWLMTFTTFFLILGVIAPLINDASTEQDTGSLVGDSADTSLDTTFGIPTGILSVLGNILLLPFWTFGFPAMINFLLLIIRIPFIFLISRNIWVGGGG